MKDRPFYHIWSCINEFPYYFVEQWQVYRLNRLLQAIDIGISDNFGQNVDFEKLRIKHLNDLKMLPVMDKNFLQNFNVNDRPDFVNLLYRKRLVPYFYCGYDGKPFINYFDNKFFRQWHYLLEHVGFQQVDLKYGRAVSVSYANSADMDTFSDNLLLVSSHDIQSNPKNFLSTIFDFKPDYIFFGNLKHLDVFYDFLTKNSAGKAINFKAAFLCATQLSDNDRKKFTNAMGCELFLFSYLMPTEAPFLGWECEQHRGFHLNRQSYILEILDENNRRVSAGKEGKLVVTYFDNEVMPKVRYDTGDRGYFLDQQCSCGRRSPLFKIVRENKDIRVNNRTVHYDDLADIFRYFYGLVKKFNVIQSGNSIKIAILPSEKWDPKFLVYLKNAVAEAVGDIDSVRFELIK